MNKTLDINTRFSREVYRFFLKKKHGVGSCCTNELPKMLVKKELCDLQKMILPEYCQEEEIIVPPPCS